MAPNPADLAPQGPDDPEELHQLLVEQPFRVAQGLLRMAKVHWTAHEVLDALKAHLAEPKA